VIGLTKTVAREYSARSITSNAVAPGFIASDMTAAIDKKYEEMILKGIPLGEVKEMNKMNKQGDNPEGHPTWRGC